MELCSAPPSAAPAEADQQLLLCSVTAPLHGDGMATLLCPLRSGAPSAVSGMPGGAFSVADGSFTRSPPEGPSRETHTAAGVPLSALVADGASIGGGAGADGDLETADQSFVEFARNVWPGLGDAK